MNTENLHEFYSNENEDGRLLSKHGQIEFRTTMRYIERYLQGGMRILEIGAATGRYAHTLARMGYEVDAVELVQHNIDVFNANTQDGERITVTQGDARDLSFIPDDTYDMTLLLGPMYHLFGDTDKHAALSEALRVTKPNGLVYVAYCIIDISMISIAFGRGQYQSLIDTGLLDTRDYSVPQPCDSMFNLCRLFDINALMSRYRTERLHYVATDGMTEFIKEAVDGMDDEMYEHYVDYHFAICERPDCVGVTNHSLDIHRKL